MQALYDVQLALLCLHSTCTYCTYIRTYVRTYVHLNMSAWLSECCQLRMHVLAQTASGVSQFRSLGHSVLMCSMFRCPWLQRVMQYRCSCIDYRCPLLQVPQDGIEVTLTLISLTPGVVFAPGGDTAAIVVAPCSQTVYSFAQQSRFLVTEGRKEVSLTIERPRCIFVSGNVLVSSSTPTQPVQLGALTLQPAMKGVDFTSVSRVVQFDDGEVSTHYVCVSTFPVQQSVCV